MSDISLTAGVRNSLAALQDTNALSILTQTRLATGKKVNSALDNPSSFFTASGLTSRANDLSSLLDDLGQSVQQLQAANNGITSLQKLVASAKSTANQALADKSAATTGTPASAATLTAGVAFSGVAGNTDGTIDFQTPNASSKTAEVKFTLADGDGNSTTIQLDKSTLSSSVTDLTHVSVQDVVKAINNQISNAGATGPAVTAASTADGRITFQSTSTGSTAGITTTNAAAADTGEALVDIGFGKTASTVLTAAGSDGTGGAAAAKLTGLAGELAASNAVNDLTGKDASFTLKLGTGKAKTITIDENVTAATAKKPTGTEIAAAIQKQIVADADLSGKVKASFDTTNNKLVLSTTATGADQAITVNSSGATFDIGFGKGTSVADFSVVGKGATGGDSSTRATLAAQFNDLRDQISQLSQDSSYGAVNLLYRSNKDDLASNKLHVNFNEKNTSGIDIQGVKDDADGLGIDQVDGKFQSDDEINKAIAQLNTASTTLRSQASTFGSNLTVVQNRQDFTKNLISTLNTGSDNLTLADTNEEGANQLALSTRQSLAQTSISLANTAAQGVLSFLR